ncbi:SDR family NAD(P)-dependent oxidoreductase [Novosphingopyxis iocasae]|uniref:SDR family NAD(P)-dependent oxidoreductase n=1 Tax=Novosphingopyxis iocasae TaxID=2762729 RepID=UPI001651081A|nr:SDR family oxidoreductase [Novosphingopyxis iocasae]
MTKIAIVTGGAQGIGRAIVHHFLEKGWRAVALDKDSEAVEDLRGAYPGKPLLAIACDVGKEDAVGRAFEDIAEWQEGEPAGIDLLVNNAGIATPYAGPIEELSFADWQAWIDASLTSAFLCARAFVPGLKRRKGAIVNIASTRAVMSEPNSEPYASAKGGLLALTHALAISLGPDVRVNAVLPGWIETGPWQKASERNENPEHRDVDRQQHPVGRIGKPEDIAAAVDYLSGEQSGFVTGQHFAVDGGMTVKMIYEH